MTWFKAESQIPINVGDKNYDPLFPYGWGLQTGSQKDQVDNARNLAEQAITTPARMSATAALTANAEHDLAAGNTSEAMQLLVQARSLALAIPDYLIGEVWARRSFLRRPRGGSITGTTGRRAAVACGSVPDQRPTPRRQ